jgi:hypothetical protein
VHGFKLLWPYTRYGRGRYLLSAGLSLAGTAALLVPYWAVYDALRATQEK